MIFRGYDRPTVLETTGYDISLKESQYEPTGLLNANQVTLAHRFFGGSIPASNDWKKLDIYSGASRSMLRDDPDEAMMRRSIGGHP